jgi:hypothetical protein
MIISFRVDTRQHFLVCSACPIVTDQPCYYHAFLVGNTSGSVSKADVEAGTDAVTRADMLAQEIIEGSLRHHFPGINVVGEEDIDAKDYQVREFVPLLRFFPSYSSKTNLTFVLSH